MLTAPDSDADTGILWSWRLPCWPQVGQSVVARRIANHPVDYLEHEGPTRSNRGTVRRIAAGQVSWQWMEPDCMKFFLIGPTKALEMEWVKTDGSEEWVLTHP